MVRAVDWLFRDRVSGRITIVQLPNATLGIFAVATALRIAVHPAGAIHTVLAVVATTALVLWAGDEVLRGVNPWGRLLGAGVLALTIVSLAGMI